MGRPAAELLDLDLPQTDKRLLAIVETDGCFTTGLSVATNCWVDRRTMRVEDYGKVAATFVDTQAGRTVRVAGHRAICDRCGEEILNEREVVPGGATLCRHCAGGGYYHVCDGETDQTPATEMLIVSA